MLELTIANTMIRTDAVGRYCLNDLHRAAGGEKRHQPANWLRTQQTQELVAELDSEAIPGIPGIDLEPIPQIRGIERDSIARIRAIESKQGLGTFVVKELVYAYATWISPAFHLKVIRAYAALMTRLTAPSPATLSRMQLIELAMQAEQDRLALEHKVGELAPKAAALDQISAGTEALTLTQAAKLLGCKLKDLTTYLHAESWIYRQNGSWVAYAEHIQNGRLLYKKASFTDEKTGLPRRQPYCHVLPKGLTRLAAHFSAQTAH